MLVVLAFSRDKQQQLRENCLAAVAPAVEEVELLNNRATTPSPHADKGTPSDISCYSFVSVDPGQWKLMAYGTEK